MNKLLQAINTTPTSETYNGALTYSSTTNPVLDLFFVIGASRNVSEENISTLVHRAIAYDKNLTLKCILWAGDIREGCGERRAFKICLSILEKNYPELFTLMFPLVPFFSRWDVLFQFKNNSQVMEFIKSEFFKTEPSGLLMKWLPRRKQYDNFKAEFLKYVNLTEKQYRKRIVYFSKVVETQMSKKEWNEISYSQVPSVAFNKYKKAFGRNDSERFGEFVKKVNKGEAKVNASVLYPYQLYQSYLKKESSEVIEAQWKNLQEINLSGSILPVCDVSGSMEGLPMAISVSLGVYLSERIKGVFQDHFITFSSRPSLQKLTGSVIDRFNQLDSAEWGMTTDLQKVFNLILTSATSKQVPQEEMPEYLLIISDMEFNQATKNKTNFESIQEKYKEAGYIAPKILFWNVNGRPGNCPVQYNEQGVGLISGATPVVIKNVFKGNFNPIDIMEGTLNVERYNEVIK